MKKLSLLALAACGGGAATAPPPAPPPAVAVAPPAPAAPEPPPARLTIPVEYHKLDNGLRVVIAPAPVPKVVVAVYYHIGYRIEPKGRTGFAHLFEHLMFQGSSQLKNSEFDHLTEGNGGFNNGSTNPDFTNYWEVMPAGALELVLWAEADRMHGLAITAENLKNQQDVVSNEVRNNVLNVPYGGFPWIDMPMAANENWFNNHNSYGDLADIQAANLDDVKTFFDSYYRPSNAVLVISGGADAKQTFEWVQKYFAPLPSKPRPNLPDISEPRQEQEKRKVRVDPLAPRPALAVGWHIPPRGTPERMAMAALNQILGSGKDSLLHEALVLTGQTGNVGSFLNVQGDEHNVAGPALMTTFLFHDADKKPDDLLALIDREVQKLIDAPVDAATLERAKTKLRSQLYDQHEQQFGVGRVDLLASYALFDDDPARINRVEGEIQALTPELLQRTAKEYLRRTNRTVLILETKGKQP